MIDLIGDIHGHADELEMLLKKLGYTKEHKFYSHPNPDRKVLFVGDYIDRGPKNRETLEIVKQMVDNGTAIALMGNHEYNALCFHLKDANGEYLREHSEKNIQQHIKTIEHFKDRPKEFKMYLEWFKTLPLFYETETFRAVHACWDYNSIDYLKKNLENNKLTDAFIRESETEKGALYRAIENTLKGKEITIPGEGFLDKYKHRRNEMRFKWWEDLKNKTYKEMSVQEIKNLPNIKIDSTSIKDNNYYKKDDKMVFFGHYWLEIKDGEEPAVFRDNICCLDYSVAKEGHLVAYTFDDELTLDNKNFTYVKNT
ncbi:metallophosphoesterase [Oceanihabitans sediminis]|uniref:metallophosphoesterase n=1 Tax=Oceanihabitans sediminis TaxID=1812012 RepID=UPI003A957ED2